MPRNAPCWCLSGKKWKNCHRDRDQQKPVDVWSRLNALNKAFAQGFCSHPNAGVACGQVIRSHTIQKKRGLEAIAEDGHVISIKSAFQNIFRSKGNFSFGKIGVNDASTFPGFCNTHDTSMFKMVENGPFEWTREAAFLLSFRALAYERFTKLTAHKTHEIMRDMDKGDPFPVQCQKQDFLRALDQGTMLGLRDLENAKNHHDKIFISRDFSTFHFIGLTFSHALPVVSSGAILLENDFAGQPLQALGQLGPPLDYITFNLTAVNDQSVGIFGWIGDNRPAEKFVRSFEALDQPEKSNAMIRFAFEHLENTYLRPSWWASISDSKRDVIVSRVMTGLPSVDFERDPGSLRPDGQVFASAPILEERKY